MAGRGVVAAGHPLTAEAGAGILRAGGNAVDAALAALLASFMTEPLLTGLGAGGYMLVAPPGGEPVLLDFMVEAPGRGADPARRAPLDAIVVDFGDAVQKFHIGASSCGVYGTAGGRRRGGAAVRAAAAGAARRARARARPRRRRRQPPAGVPVGAAGADRARHAAGALRQVPREGETLRDAELADGLERLARDGAAPFYTGEIGAAVSD